MTPKSYYTINQPLFNSTLSCYIESRTLEIESEIETCAKACKVDKCHWKYSGLRNWECEWWLLRVHSGKVVHNLEHTTFFIRSQVSSGVSRHKFNNGSFNPNSGGLLDVAWVGGFFTPKHSEKPFFFWFFECNELRKFTKFGTSRPIFSWRNSCLKKMMTKCNRGRGVPWVRTF